MTKTTDDAETGEVVYEWPSFARPGERALTLGSAGSDVRWLQTMIGDMCGPADGLYGPATQEGVLWYQQVRGITEDGTAGDATIQQLRGNEPRGNTKVNSLPKLAYGAQGSAVREAQRTLNQAQKNRRTRIPVDGIMWDKTVRAVQEFQRHARIDPTGIITTQTWRKMGY